MKKKPIKIERLTDRSGQWYWIPEEAVNSFKTDLRKLDGKDYIDAPEQWELFNKTYSKYRTLGSPRTKPAFFKKELIQDYL